MTQKTLLLLFSALLITACERFTHVSGKITDEFRNPVPAASITLEGSIAKSVQSAEDGTFSITASHWGSPKFTIVVYKSGFYESRTELPPSSGASFYRDIKLKSDKIFPVPLGDFDTYPNEEPR